MWVVAAVGLQNFGLAPGDSSYEEYETCAIPAILDMATTLSGVMKGCQNKPPKTLSTAALGHISAAAC